jgi:hypothetical protein
MCDRRLAPLFLILTMGVLPAATAQRPEQWRDSALRLEVQVRALRDSLLQGDSTVAEVTRRDDLVIGASEQLRGTAAGALQRFIRARARWFGGATPSPAGFRIVLRSDATGGRDEWWLTAQMETVLLAGLPDSAGAMRTQRNVARRRIADNLIDLYGEMMYASAGPALLTWLESVPPLSMPDQERRHLAMYALVTGTGKAQRGCVAGDLADCASALTLGAPTGMESAHGYAPIVRADLLLTALELGGARGWGRFRQAAGQPIATALAAAAGMPADSLLAHWRSGLLVLRPSDTPVSLKQVLVAVGWTAGLLLGAMGVARWA